MCLTKYVTMLSKKDFNMFGNEFLVYHLSKMCLSQFLFYLTLQYCIGFAIYQNESATGIHVLPILDPLPSSLPIPSLWVVPVYQPQASSIVHWTWTGDSFHIWYYTYFNAILPNHPTLSLSHRVHEILVIIMTDKKELVKLYYTYSTLIDKYYK